MKKLSIILLPLVFAGCATSNTATVEKAAAAPTQKVAKLTKAEEAKAGLVCERRAQTGTRFVKKRCWKKEEYEARKERDQELLRKARDTVQTGGGPTDL